MKRILLVIISLFCTCFFMAATANPIVAPGGFNPNQVSIQQQGSTMTIHQNSHTAFIKWDQFNIQNGETTTFQQPSRSSVAVNRVNALNGRSEIFGTLNANGRLVLINQAGIYFGDTAFVNVGSIIASTSDMTKFNAQKYVFDIPSKYSDAAVINRGTINAADYGLVALIGNRVENSGNITAHAGSVVMGAGNKFTLDFRGDQLINFSIDEAASDGDTTQAIKDLGTVHVSAATAQKVLDHVINTQHAPEAVYFAEASNGDLIFSNGKIDVSNRSLGQRGGKVKLLANRVFIDNASIDASGDSGGGEVLIGGNYQGKGPEFNANLTYVGPNTYIKADAMAKGNGGKVIAWANDDTYFYGNISAKGGALGGNGGFVETSGHYLDVTNATVNTLASKGNTGTWLLDPENVTISNSSDSNASYSNGVYAPTGDNSIINVGNLQNALASNNVMVTTGTIGSQTGDITVQDPITWATTTTLTLSAYHDINVNNTITNNVGGSLVLQANNTGDFAVGSNEGIVSVNNSANININDGGVGGHVNIYYNPSSYASPVTYTNNGTGALTAYMLVNDVTDLQNIGNYLSNNFALSKDIDASVTRTWNTGAGFLPVGTSSAQFTGNFDGQNHVIDNLYINRPDLGHAGLFGDAQSGTISNVGLTHLYLYSGGDSITNDQALGGMVGYLTNGTLNNVFVTGTIIETPSAQCSGCGIGGLVGFMSNGTILNSYNAASVTSPLFSVGGLVGNETDGTVRNSYNSGPVYAFFEVGGLVGTLGGSTGGTIYNSYNIGSVVSPNSANGLVSHAFPGTLIENSYASGSVSGGNASSGLVGTLESGAVIHNSFWDTQTTGQSTSAGSTGAAGYRGMTTSDMQTVSNFETGSSFINGAGWNITNIPNTTSTPPNTVWFMANGTRPMLISELFPSDSSGFPTGDSPYSIRNAHQLQLMGSTLGANYDLASDVNMATVRSNNADVWGGSLINQGFSPIGDSSNSFTGNFDGQNHVIDNLFINRPTLELIGLFANVAGNNTIQNIGLTNANIYGAGTASNSLGGLVGLMFNSTVRNAFVTGSITQAPGAGCSGCAVGGLVGGIASGSGLIEDSYNAATVTGTAPFSVGGLVGYVDSNATINRSYNSGAVNGAQVGGLVGGLGRGNISDSYNIGSVNGSYQAGGLVGQGNYGTITNSYSSGPVSGSGAVGGLIAVVANFGNLTINNSFWDTQTSGVTNASAAGPVSGVTGLTTNQALTQNTYTGWDFGSTWFIPNYGDTANPYTRPILQSEYSTTIRNGHQLQLVAMNSFADYTLANDIYLNITNPADIWGTNTTSGRGFISLGGPVAYYGTFDGNHHVIDGLYMNWTNFSSTAPALFSDTDASLGAGIIKNIGLTNINLNFSVDNGGGGALVWFGGDIRNSYSTGTIHVTGLGDQVIAGGLIGTLWSGQVINSYSTVDIYATGTGSVFDIGGLAGRAFPTSTISDSYSTGKISVTPSAGAVNKGGFLGLDAGGSYSDNFWDTDTSGLLSNAGVSATGMTTADMLVQDHFPSSWVFGSNGTWFIPNYGDTAGQYTRPILQSEYNTTITNGHQLQLMAMDLSANYTLGHNADLSNIVQPTDIWATSTTSGTGFIPIGNSSTPFTGIFDGQHYAINNLYINIPTSISTIGLFGTANLGANSISNLALANVNITGGSGSASVNVGSVVGQLQSGRVNGVYASGAVTSNSDTSYVGGLVGELDGATIEASYNTASVTSGIINGGPGGIAGGVFGGTIDNSYNSGTVFNSAGTVGGLTTILDFGATISNSYNTGAVIAALGGGAFQGGLVGVIDSGSINNSYWDTQTTGQNNSAGFGSGGTGLTTAQFQTALPSGFSSSTWGIIPGYSYPYLLTFFPTSAPRAVSGFIPNGSTGATGLANNTVQIATNGTNISTNDLSLGSVASGDNGYYYFLEPNGTIADNSALLTYLPGGSANAVTLAPVVDTSPTLSGSIAGLDMQPNTVTVGDSSTQTLDNTNTLLQNAAGNLPSDILYSVSGTNITLNSGVGLSSTATTTYNLNGNVSETGSGNIEFGGPVTLGAASTLTSTAGQVNFDSTIDGAFDLTVSAGDTATFKGNVGNSNNLNTIDVTASNIHIDNDISLTTTGTQTYHSPITFGGTSGSGADFTSNNGDITFGSTLDGFFKSANLSAPNGTVQLNGVVGGINPLFIFSVTANSIDIETSGISTIKNQDYFGPVVLGQSTTFTTDLDAVTFHGTLNSLTSATANNATMSNSDVIFDGALGGINPLGTITANKGFINANVTTTGDQLYSDDVSVTSNPVLAGNNIQMSGNILGDGSSDISINGSGSNSFLNGTFSNISNINFGGTGTFSLNNTSALSSLGLGTVAISSGGTLSMNNMAANNVALNLNGGTLLSTGTSQLGGPITVNASSTIATNSLTDALTIATTINGVGGLSLQGPGSMNINGAIGNGTPLASLTSSVGSLFLGGGAVHTAGNQNYSSPVTLASNTAMTSTAGNISFQGINGGNHNLDLTGIQMTLAGALSNLNNVTATGISNSSLAVLTNDSQTWTTNNTNQGNISPLTGINSFQFSNISNITGGTGANTFDFSAYPSAVALTLTSNSSGVISSPFAISFNNFSSIKGPTSSSMSIGLPTLSTANNLLITKPTGSTEPLALLNGVFTFNFSQLNNNIRGGLMGDKVDLSNIHLNSQTTNSDGSITFSIADPIFVTFIDFNNFTLPPPPSDTGNVNIAETLTQGVTTGQDALQRTPSGNTTQVNSNPTSMLTTATQAIDTAFGNTKVSNEKPGGGCGGGATMQRNLQP